MKTLFAAACVTFLGLASQVSSARSIHPDTFILLDLRSSGGFRAGSVGVLDGVKVQDDGTIIKYWQPSCHTPMVTEEVGKLSPKILAVLTDELSEMKDGQIIFDNSPRCTDVPHNVYSSHGRVFAESAACQTGYLEGFDHAPYLKKFLDSLNILGSKLVPTVRALEDAR